MSDKERTGEEFQRLVDIISKLRSEEGCPWDREQDERSITNFFLEEVYEAVEAISADDIVSVAEELGDVMMELVFLAQIYEEKERFTMTDILDGINQKMIRRHPHVFADKQVKSSKHVIRDWNRQKNDEKERRSVFDGLVQIAPALLTAYQISQRVSSCGFDWKDAQASLGKLKEEISELEKALAGGDLSEITSELGDAFFSLANVSRLTGVNPEVALRGSNKKFIRRFKHIEKELKQKGKSPEESSLEEMDELWEKAKSMDVTPEKEDS